MKDVALITGASSGIGEALKNISIYLLSKKLKISYGDF